jgi:hypothetical protein
MTDKIYLGILIIIIIVLLPIDIWFSKSIKHIKNKITLKKK